jgi:4-hydroxybenzoate polyprenyltransferase
LPEIPARNGILYRKRRHFPRVRASEKARAILELVRVFLTPSALSNSYAGLCLAAGALGSLPSPGKAAAVAATSIVVYWLGMAANDWMDMEKDRVRSPQRPLPSGRVTAREAALLCAVLAASALALGYRLDVLPLVAGLVLAALLYDAGGKKLGILGDSLLGFCRAGNLILGAAALLGVSRALGDEKILLSAAILGLYATGITAVSRLEDAPFEAKALRLRAAALALAPALLVGFGASSVLAWLNGALLSALLFHCLRAACKPPTAQHGAALFVRKALGGIFLVDAGIILAFAEGPLQPGLAAAAPYGLLALSSWWKRGWIRRGHEGS